MNLRSGFIEATVANDRWLRRDCAGAASPGSISVSSDLALEAHPVEAVLDVLLAVS